MSSTLGLKVAAHPVPGESVISFAEAFKVGQLLSPGLCPAFGGYETASPLFSKICWWNYTYSALQPEIVHTASGERVIIPRGLVGNCALGSQVKVHVNPCNVTS